MRIPAALQYVFSILLVGLFFLVFTLSARAETPEELRARIEERNKQIRDLEVEIAEFEKQLNSLGKEKQSLQNTIKTLDLTRKKITKDISLTQSRIAGKDLEISELKGDISDTSTLIRAQTEGVRESLRTINELDEEPVATTMLSGGNLSSFFDDVVGTMTLKAELEKQIGELKKLKSGLETSKNVAETKRAELAVLKRDLAGQQKVLDANRAQQQQILKETQNKEANYQAQLTEKRKIHEAFEQELLDYENQLKIAIDPSVLPRQGKGVLAWPLDNVRITQYFGNTPFSTANPQVYSGRGHNGIDLSASVGTRIKASRSGMAEGTGDTDLTCRSASYGKWVLVEHGNGLSTLYAHLSYIGVTTGQQVSLGEVVGYSGNTGYSTGPHLHFAVFATQGVRIQQLPSKALACRGRIYTLPVADPKAYLNPLSYL